MKRAAHIVQRQHTVLLFYVFHNGAPMFVVVQLCAQYLKTEVEDVIPFVRFIEDLYFTPANLVVVINEPCENMAAERETVVVVLQD